MLTIIDPTKLESNDAKRLFAFLESQSKENAKVWKKETTYTFTDNSQFQFSHDVVQRQRKPGKDGFRYEFVSERRLGRGSSGAVYEIDGTLAIDENNLLFKPCGYKGKTRVVKIQYMTTSVKKEYELSNKAGHLGVKCPTVAGSISYTVMKKLEGRELFDILFEDLSQQITLTLKQRVDLSRKLLLALKEQVTDRDIIHRDIKGENIFVDMDSPISVNIFDFGLGMHVNQLDDSHPGTHGYAAPEIFSDGEHTTKVDVYSMGRVLALIWHVDVSSYSYPGDTSIEKIAYDAANVDLSSLFLGIEGLSLNNQTIIKSTLEAMLRADSIQRITVDEAIEEFAKIDLSFAPQTPVSSEPLAAALKLTNASKTEVIAAVRPECVRRIDEILQHIDQLKIQSNDLQKRKKGEAALALFNLADDLEKKLKGLKKLSSSEYQSELMPCLQQCKGLIRDKKSIFDSHRNTNYIWANIALGIAGIGLLYAAALLINRVVFNKWFFFTQTKSSQLVETAANSMENLKNL